MTPDALVHEEGWPHAEIHLPEDLSRFNNWLLETILPYIKGNVLEMDSGTGEMSALFSMLDVRLHLNDISKYNRDRLRERFNDMATVKAVRNINLQSKAFTKTYSSYLGKFSTLIALNVSDHGLYDKTAILNAKELLRGGGYLIIIVPAYTAMYHGFGNNEEGWKKYNRSRLNKLLGADLEIMKVRYLNINESKPEDFCKRLGLSVLAVARKNTER